MQDHWTINFPDWFQWADRGNTPGNEQPGVYLLARFEDQSKPIGNADPLIENVIYIGQSAQKMINRWKSFDATAFGGRTKKPHKGALLYKDLEYQEPLKTLYVASMVSVPQNFKSKWDDWVENPGPIADALNKREGIRKVTNAEVQKYGNLRRSKPTVKEKGPLNQAWVMYVERKLILDFILRWDRLPTCNRQ